MASVVPQTSVILKRQVPIRFNEQVGSWLGGRPKLPDTIEWPLSEKGRPLEFIAQVACDDLPKQLWDGEGPRNGWLLLFIDTPKLEDTGRNGVVQVLHVSEAGPERDPPTVKVQRRNVTPKVWRKWPVDLHVQTYERPVDDAITMGPPRLTSADLYDAPAAGSGFIHLESDTAPLTWGGALHHVESILKRLDPKFFWIRVSWEGQYGPRDPDWQGFEKRFKKGLERKGLRIEHRSLGEEHPKRPVVDEVLAKLIKQREKGWLRRNAKAMQREILAERKWMKKYQRRLRWLGWRLSPEEKRILEHSVAHCRERLEGLVLRRDEFNAFLETLPQEGREKALIAEYKRTNEAYVEWGREQYEVLKGWKRHFKKQKPETALPREEWDRYSSELESKTCDYWRGDGYGLTIQKFTKRLSDFSDKRGQNLDEILDLYAHSAEAQNMLPAALIAKLEPQLRSFDEDLVPHRVGGLRDAIQGESDPKETLLFQIGSDNALGFMWGDVGAVYVTIGREDLKQGRFENLTAWIDGH